MYLIMLNNIEIVRDPHSRSITIIDPVKNYVLSTTKESNI
jgi:hypothetical protein